MTNRLVLRALLLCCCLVVLAPKVEATHNLAGEITYYRVGTNTYRITIVTYTDSACAGVDRCAADLEIWGINGSTAVQTATIRGIPRNNGPLGNNTPCYVPNAHAGVFLRTYLGSGGCASNTVKRNTYVTTYTFPGPGQYELRYYDFARITSVRNINNPGAVAFYINTVLFNNPFIGNNDSPQLLNDPLDDACTNRKWTHNPGGYDPNGDSLVYSLIPNKNYNPEQGINSPVNAPGYQYPDNANFGASTFTIDPRTGLVTWLTPQQVGVYNIAILIQEYRNGRLIGSVVRDMAIFVKPCLNLPPIIHTLADTCIKPGTLLTFLTNVTDGDPSDSVYVYLNNGNRGLNGPFAVNVSPATLTPSATNFPIVTGIQPQSALFIWNVVCEHIRLNPYQVDWYAHDNLIRGTEPTLSDNKISLISVVPERLDSVWASPGARSVALRWTPHNCSNAINYNIYRSSGPGQANNDSICCGKGYGNIPPGYTRIAVVNGHSSTSYIDDNNGQGLAFAPQYCYIMSASFPGGVESCPTNTICIQLSRTLPLLVNDSVITTDAANGKILVRWARPDLTKLDTNFYRPPYTYRLERAAGQGSSFAVLPFSFTFNDTTFIDSSINTVAQNYSHRISFYDSTGQLIQLGNSASSIFLTATGINYANRIQWTESTPWRNQLYELYRSVDDINNPYVLLDTILNTGGSGSHTYIDDSLTPGRNYCYFVRSTGTYNRSDIREPLKNDSNRGCAIPRDSIPPCPIGQDSVTIVENCDSFRVDVRWIRADSVCASDAAFYRVYFSRTRTGTRSLLFQTLNTAILSYRYSNPNGITGCYVVTVVDSFGNESVASQQVCSEDCIDIEIPNVFPPGGGGAGGSAGGGWQIPNTGGIVSAKTQIFDRWGYRVFANDLIQTAWKGTTPNGAACPAGVYFYVMEITLNDLNFSKIVRTGSISLLR